MVENFPSNYPNYLSGVLQESQDNIIGSPEKHDFVNILKQAICFKLRKDESGVSGWMGNNLTSIICHLSIVFNFVYNHTCPIWIECDYDALVMYGNGILNEEMFNSLKGNRLGFLFFKEENNMIGCSIAWSRPSVNENDVANLSICPVVQHIDISRFNLLHKDVKPRFFENLLFKHYNHNFIKSSGDLHELLSLGIGSSFLNGIIDDASIINGHEDDNNWKESYSKISGVFASRLIFFGIASLVTMFINSDKKISIPGYAIYNQNKLFWRQYKSPLDVCDCDLNIYLTGQYSLKTQ